jgi:hypothetical protein
MTDNVHARARQLFSQSLVEGLSVAERSWLDGHLQGCAECSGEIARMQELLRSFRNVRVAVPHDLAARTQMRVRLRAQEAGQTSGSGALLWVITGASWLLGIFTAPLIWRVFAWAGAQLNVPKLVLEFGFVLWWTVPALIAVAVVLHHRAMNNGFVRRTDA